MWLKNTIKIEKKEPQEDISEMKYKAIALDIDGTLVTQKQEITPATKEALIRYQKAGGRLIMWLCPMKKMRLHMQ